MSGLEYSVSATTRPPRSNEKQGEDYFFLSEEEFDEWISAGKLLEWAEFCGYRYGTPLDYVKESVENGKTVLLDIDIKGAAQIRERMRDAVLVFLVPPGIEELRQRIEKRGTEAKQSIARRLEEASRELKAIVNYDYVVLNDDIDKAVSDVCSIITAELLRVSRSNYKDLVANMTKG